MTGGCRCLARFLSPGLSQGCLIELHDHLLRPQPDLQGLPRQLHPFLGGVSVWLIGITNLSGFAQYSEVTN